MAVLRSSTLRQAWSRSSGTAGARRRLDDTQRRHRASGERASSRSPEATDPKPPRSWRTSTSTTSTGCSRATPTRRRRQETQYMQQLERAAPRSAQRRKGGAQVSRPTIRLIAPTPRTRAAWRPRQPSGNDHALELQREVMRMNLTEHHPQMQEVQKQIAELKRQYSRNLFGAPWTCPRGGRREKEFFVATEKTTPVSSRISSSSATSRSRKPLHGRAAGIGEIKYTRPPLAAARRVLDPANAARPSLEARRPFDRDGRCRLGDRRVALSPILEYHPAPAPRRTAALRAPTAVATRSGRREPSPTPLKTSARSSPPGRRVGHRSLRGAVTAYRRPGFVGDVRGFCARHWTLVAAVAARSRCSEGPRARPTARTSR